MFDNFSAGQTIRIKMSGSAQGLAMRVQYLGAENGVHHMSGIGFMSDAKLTARESNGVWTLGNGRTLVAAEMV